MKDTTIQIYGWFDPTMFEDELFIDNYELLDKCEIMETGSQIDALEFKGRTARQILSDPVTANYKFFTIDIEDVITDFVEICTLSNQLADQLLEEREEFNSLEAKHTERVKYIKGEFTSIIDGTHVFLPTEQRVQDMTTLNLEVVKYRIVGQILGIEDYYKLSEEDLAFAGLAITNELMIRDRIQKEIRKEL